jgi:chaperonin GroEL
VTLLTAALALEKHKLEGDEIAGATILKRALEEPMRMIVANAGYEGSVVVEEVRRLQAEKKSKTIGFDVVSESYKDMLDAGIIDPAKVTRSAVENAVSIASMILSTEALVTDIPEPVKPQAPMPEY